MAINDPRQLRDKVYYKVSYKNVKILHHSKAGTYAIKLISVKNYNSIAILEFYILNLELPYRHWLVNIFWPFSSHYFDMRHSKMYSLI